MALSPVSSYESNSAHNDLLDALSALHLGGKYSDLKVTCNYRQWSVHKAIVCSRSGFLDGACSHKFREAETGVIDLSDDDEEAVEQMIYYLYNLDYLNPQSEQKAPATSMFRHRAYSDARRRLPQQIDFTKIEDPLLSQAGFYNPQTDAESSAGSPRIEVHSCPEKTPRSAAANHSATPSLEIDDGSEEEDFETTEAESHLILHTLVYALAEKYDIPSLKTLARRKFEIAISCYYDAPELAEAIERVYSSTVESDRGLRDVVLQLFKLHPQLANTQDIYTIIKETPTLALDLWKVERGLL